MEPAHSPYYFSYAFAHKILTCIIEVSTKKKKKDEAKENEKEDR